MRSPGTPGRFRSPGYEVPVPPCRTPGQGSALDGLLRMGQGQIGVLAALSRSGVAVPGEMSVAGYDDIFSRPSCFSLSTVSQRPEEQARHAVTAAVERLDEGRIEPREVQAHRVWLPNPTLRAHRPATRSGYGHRGR
ncbi:substrate-binding domain-containing protein [Streptomyces decoyicus]|uniref:substrate-binding domain-containing protein n=1 Tax=Streptomyces decoyicus TaxID=249567 RepID=UPI00363CAE72